MNLQVQAYKGETQRCSRLDNKQHIRWWKKSKILIALSGWGSAQDRSCRGSQPVGVFWGFFTFPTARRQKESAIKPKVNFLVFNVNSVQPGLEDVRHPNSTWIMNQQGGESICLRKVFKRTPVRTGFPWIFDDSVLECKSAAHYLMSLMVLTPHLLMWMWDACSGASITIV